MSSTVFASNQNGDLPADVTVLTTGVDTVLASDADQEVRATAATLTPSTTNYATIPSTVTPGDALEGGAGHDVLALSGPGSFNLAGLAKFSGFEEVRLTNLTNSSANLILRDGVDLAVTLSDGTTAPTTPLPPYSPPYSSTTTGGISVALGAGKVTLQGGNESDTITVSAPSKLVAGSVIDGGGGFDTLNLSYDAPPVTPIGPVYDPATGTYTYPTPVYHDSVYDLTGISLRHVESLNISGYSLLGTADTSGKMTIVKADAAALADVKSLNLSYNAKLSADASALDGLTSISLSNGATLNTGTASLANVTSISLYGGTLTTSAASLDLSSKYFDTSLYFAGGGKITSDNAAGTTFTVGSANVAFLVQGGAGQDTVVVKDLTLNQAQRDQIFSGSVETITDASGTYTKAVDYYHHGRAIDGYISGATVFADANGNGVQDAGEASTTTDATGAYTLAGGSGPIIVKGGTDIASGLAFAGTLKALAGSSVVTPLTTLVAALAAAGVADPAAKALAALGLPASTDLATLDPVASAASGDAVGKAAFVAGLKFLDTATLIASTVAGPAAAGFDGAFAQAVAQIAKSVASTGAPLTTAALSDPATVAGLVAATAKAAGVTLGEGIAAGAGQTAANLNAALDGIKATGSGALAEASAIVRVAQGTASQDLGSATPTTIATVAASYAGTKLAGAIQTASHQTGDVDGPGVNSAPITAADAYKVGGGSSLKVAAGAGVLANDVDPDGSALAAHVVSGPQHGTLTLSESGAFVYTAEAGFAGVDHFTYAASDGTLASGATGVDITVAPVAPAARDTLVLKVSETAYKGDAQFVVLVDGKQVGDVQTATAAHGSGTDTITLQGNFLGHQVAVKYLNDLNDGPGHDRNLFIDSVSLNGHAATGSTATIETGKGTAYGTAGELWSNGSAVFRFDAVHDLVKTEGGATTTQHYDAYWNFIGADQTKASGTGTSVQHFDAKWAFTGAELSTVDGGWTTTRHYDATWALTGSEATKVDGTRTSTQHFDSHGALTGVDLTVQNGDSSGVQHYDAHWSFTGADLIARTATSETVQHYDASWHLTGADVAKLDHNQIVTQHYDANWHLTATEMKIAAAGGAGAWLI